MYLSGIGLVCRSGQWSARNRLFVEVRELGSAIRRL